MAFTLLFLTVITFLPKSVNAQLKVTNFEELDSCMQSEKRPIILYFYTDWCKYCNKLKNTTLHDLKVIELINNKYYFLAFNGEHKSDIIFDNQIFKFKPNGFNTGIHELLINFVGKYEKVTYPSVLVLDHNYSLQKKMSSYMNASEFSVWLTDFR